jgi:hypothetical protein
MKIVTHFTRRNRTTTSVYATMGCSETATPVCEQAVLQQQMAEKNSGTN